MRHQIKTKQSLLNRLSTLEWAADHLHQAVEGKRQLVIEKRCVWWDMLDLLGLEIASATQLKRIGHEPRRGFKPAFLVNMHPGRPRSAWDAWIVNVQTKPIPGKAPKPAAPAEAEDA